MRRPIILLALSCFLGCQKAPQGAVEEAPASPEPVVVSAAKGVKEEPVEKKSARVRAVEVATKTAGGERAPEKKATACGSQNGAAVGEDGQALSNDGCAPQVAAVAVKTNHFGGVFTLDESLPLASVLDNAGEYSGRTVKVRGRVAKVCKKKGCWFTVKAKDADPTYVRVTMLNYGFFVPLDCDGKDAVIEGVFKQVKVPEAHRKHLAEDGGEDPSAVKGAKKEFTMVATAIDIDG